MKASLAKLRAHAGSISHIGFWAVLGGSCAWAEPDDIVPMIFGAMAIQSITESVRKIRKRVVAHKNEHALACMLASQIMSVIDDRKFVGTGVSISATRTVDVGGHAMQVTVSETA